MSLVVHRTTPYVSAFPSRRWYPPDAIVLIATQVKHAVVGDDVGDGGESSGGVMKRFDGVTMAIEMDDQAVPPWRRLHPSG